MTLHSLWTVNVAPIRGIFRSISLSATLFVFRQHLLEVRIALQTFPGEILPEQRNGKIARPAEKLIELSNRFSVFSR